MPEIGHGGKEIVERIIEPAEAKEKIKGLTAIPWIGMELAQAIVNERSKRGGFKQINEIMDIRGIGPRLYKKIKPYVTL